DSRMKSVWNELLKRKRRNYKSSETFRYPATSPKNWSRTARAKLRRAQTLRDVTDPLNEDEVNKQELYAAFYQIAEMSSLPKGLSNQELALVCFFEQAFNCALIVSKPVPRTSAQKIRAHYLDMASRIRADVERLESFERDPLMKAVFAYEE